MLTGVILIVDGKEFHESKMFLSSQSTYFKSLFYGKFNESTQEKIELKGVDPDHFLQFLMILHGNSRLNDSNIEIVLHLSDMYCTPNTIQRCEEFLLETSEWETEEKLELAERYNLGTLKESCKRRSTKRKAPGMRR